MLMLHSLQRIAFSPIEETAALAEEVASVVQSTKDMESDVLSLLRPQQSAEALQLRLLCEQAQLLLRRRRRQAGVLGLTESEAAVKLQSAHRGQMARKVLFGQLEDF
eukprot:SAG31_NODE_5490_length_2504_cov_1.607069_1_plen_107_part_00